MFLCVGFERVVHQWIHCTCLCSNVLEVESQHTHAHTLLFSPWFTLVAHTLIFTCLSSSSGGFVFIAFYMFFHTTHFTWVSTIFFSVALSPVVCVLSCPLCAYTDTYTYIRAWLAFAFVYSIFRLRYLLWSGCEIWALALIKKAQKRRDVFYTIKKETEHIFFGPS